MTFETTGAAIAFLVARVLFGGVLAFMGISHFLNLEEMTGYAEFKGLPAPRAAVVGSGVLLVLGGGSVVAGVLPTIGAATLAGFLVLSAVTMHDFWNVEGEEAQDEMVGFLKNLFGAGGALVFLSLAGTTWPFAANIGL